MKARIGRRAAVTALGIAGLLVAAGGCTSSSGAQLATFSSNGRCANTVWMPPSKGTATPAGFTMQMNGAVLGSASSSPTLASAYQQFNDLTCTQYTHKYSEQPPRFYYYDCVGFTGYTVRTATPVAWSSLRTRLNLPTGYVPTPYRFQGFFNGLASTSAAGWQAVGSVSAIRPGDVLAWQPTLPGGAPDMSSEGHSVMPLVTPRAIAGSNGTRWEVVIMDSTAGGHGPDDTRKPSSPLSSRNAPLNVTNTSGPGTNVKGQASGLGIGTIVLDTDTSGRVTAVEWSVGAKPEPILFGAGRALS